jgi:hypothetical protein
LDVGHGTPFCLFSISSESSHLCCRGLT